MIDDEIKTCVECGKHFRVENRGDIYVGCKEREEYNCPYCNHVYHMMTSGMPFVTPIDEKD